MSKTETFSFQTEVQQLLHLMIHSLYSHKEIFLRELISNASDACDKLRFEALSDDALYEGDETLRIRVEFDKDEGVVRVIDNGIGMSRDEVVANIGTIARSGTRQFLESLSGDQARDAQMVGQFGVGFDSSCTVADKVSVRSRRAGDDASLGVHWESDGSGSYTLETVSREAHGTEVELQRAEIRVDAEGPVSRRRETDARAMRQPGHGGAVLITLFEEHTRAVGDS